MYCPAMVLAGRPLEQSAPAVFRLAADPLRWRLLSELARSDRRVRELCRVLEAPQNLVSYHLGRLRAAGVVSSRRSAADGRDSYYALDLARCGELLAVGAASLHPALGRPASPPRTWRASDSTSAQILFLCTGNSARSQIAQALVEEMTGGAVRAASAGSDPKPLHPNAVRVMAERGVDISGRPTKSLTRFARSRFDRVITLCDKVREICPEFPHAPITAHWSIADPASAGGNDKATYPVFEHVADEIESRVALLLADLRTRPLERTHRA